MPRQMNSKRTNKSKMATKTELKRDFTPVIRVKGPDFPPVVRVTPGFQKIVRQLYNFTGGTSHQFGVNQDIIQAEAADYGITTGPQYRGWNCVRLMGVDIWGPLQRPGTSTVGDLFIDVIAPSQGWIGSSVLLPDSFSDQADPSSTNNRPHISWRYGAVSNTVKISTVATIPVFTILAASPPGEYVIDYHIVLN